MGVKQKKEFQKYISIIRRISTKENQLRRISISYGVCGETQ